MVKDYVESSHRVSVSEPEDQSENLRRNEKENIEHLSKVTGIPKYKLLGDKKSQALKNINYTKMFKYRDKVLSSYHDSEIDIMEDIAPGETLPQIGKMKTRMDKESEKEQRTEGEFYLYGDENSESFSTTSVSGNMSDWTSQVTVSEKDMVSPLTANESKRRPPGHKVKSTYQRNNTKESQLKMNEKEETENLLEMFQKENEQVLNTQTSGRDKYVKESVLDEVQFDYPVRSGQQASNKEGYIYDPESGYQHPYGKINPDFEDLDFSKDELHKHEDGQNKLYKKGNNYYDSDGEFLYKAP